MKRIDLNVLLAIATAAALALLICSASLFGAPGQTLKYIILAVLCPVIYVPGNRLMRKKMGLTTPPLIHAGSPSTAIWASLFPLVLFLASMIPAIWHGKDYGLLVIIAAIWFANTVDSAIRSVRG